MESVPNINEMLAATLAEWGVPPEEAGRRAGELACVMVAAVEKQVSWTVAVMVAKLGSSPAAAVIEGRLLNDGASKRQQAARAGIPWTSFRRAETEVEKLLGPPL